MEEKAFGYQHYDKILGEARTRAQEAGIELGHPAKTIVEVAKEVHFDLILVGHTGLSEVWARFLGTTTDLAGRGEPGLFPIPSFDPGGAGRGNTAFALQIQSRAFYRRIHNRPGGDFSVPLLPPQ